MIAMLKAVLLLFISSRTLSGSCPFSSWNQGAWVDCPNTVDTTFTSLDMLLPDLSPQDRIKYAEDQCRTQRKEWQAIGEPVISSQFFQPKECVLKRLYDHEALLHCLRDKRVLLLGDSTQQELFTELVSYLENGSNSSLDDVLYPEWQVSPCGEDTRKVSQRFQSTSLKPAPVLLNWNITVDFVWNARLDHCVNGFQWDTMKSEGWLQKINQISAAGQYHADLAISSMSLQHTTAQQFGERLWPDVIPGLVRDVESLATVTIWRASSPSTPEMNAFNAHLAKELHRRDISFLPVAAALTDLPKNDPRHCSYKDTSTRTRTPWCHIVVMHTLQAYCQSAQVL